MTRPTGHRDPRKDRFKLALVGLAGTDRDFLLSLPVLKSYLITEADLAGKIEIRLFHQTQVPPEEMEQVQADLIRAVIEAEPDLIGLSVYVWNVDQVAELIPKLKGALPRCRIVIGGPEVSVLDLEAGRRAYQGADFAIWGEGEIPLAGLLKSLVGVAGEAVPRLSSNQSGKWRSGPAVDLGQGLIENLAAQDSPYLNGVVTRELLSQPLMRANIETQRGCNFRCSYCLYHKNDKGIRYRHPDTVLAELELLQEAGVKQFRITDANFFSDKEFAATILQGMIDRRFRMAFFVEVIPLAIDQRLAELLARYQALPGENPVTVGIGLQSTNRESLKAVRRLTPNRHFEKAYRLLLAAGVRIKTDLILGLPFETRESYLEMLEFVLETTRSGLNTLALSQLRILPGTDLERVAAEHGLVVDPQSTDHFVLSTPYLDQVRMTECQRYNAVVARVFNSPGNLKELYFETKERLGWNHRKMLKMLVDIFRDHLGGKGSEFLAERFSEPERYQKLVHEEVPDEVLTRGLAGLSK